MKNIAAQMINFDREQMRRIANNMPDEAAHEKRESVSR